MVPQAFILATVLAGGMHGALKQIPDTNPASVWKTMIKYQTLLLVAKVLFGICQSFALLLFCSAYEANRAATNWAFRANTIIPSDALLGWSCSGNWHDILLGWSCAGNWHDILLGWSCSGPVPFYTNKDYFNFQAKGVEWRDSQTFSQCGLVCLLVKSVNALMLLLYSSSRLPLQSVKASQHKCRKMFRTKSSLTKTKTKHKWQMTGYDR